MKYGKWTMVVFGLLLLPLMSFAKPAAKGNTYFFERDDISLKVDVILPESYDSESSALYPAVYLLDGYWTRDLVTRMYVNLRFDNMLPELIFVSIGYPGEVENIEQKRLTDLTPAYDSGFKAGGSASSLLDLISNSIVPMVGNNYRVDASRRVLTGHSLAGLFTLYAMYQKPNTFSHYAAISPSALWANETLASIDTGYAKQNKNLKAQAYITYGSDEYVPYVRALQRYTKQLEARDYDGLELSLAKVEGMRHVGMQFEGFIRALAWAFADRRPEGPSQFEKMNLKAQAE
ncbi:alpha/beta hydrolase-fold protein [Gilvimarinus sp. SDUM040013]|uniref:Alpha/beta hydrolase-fold protein n=1 Tax=Gilvimarinus gilvus TaxID=3058038 RepID=A0ABU4S336_9GAMM|nr:alpha/beta hydrolase-fold protein [Gilvimarinus sp. SDUM040013]MDO3384647.1 alpha/beta hydrolase-fold protein [Gilvimarinus sp. SDUM040013]MDX6850233.1 alpha/beta hydrolase-fold protein [Gilvimarinus sp. SDUM040013]